MRQTVLGAAVLVLLYLTCSLLQAEESLGDVVKQAASSRGVVVSASEPASLVGRDVLRDGGNAVDAAVAVAMAMAVTWPEAGNLGGGGFMLVKPPDHDPLVVDYRECAPLAASREMYEPEESTLTHRAVGVPGTVRGLWLAHQRFGRLPWKRLVEPAAELARGGTPVDAHLAASLNGLLGSLDEKDPRFQETHRVFVHPDGRPWRAGDRLVQPDLAETLDRIAQQGADAFYHGTTADQIVAEMQRGGGLIHHRDLAEYEAHLRTPVRGEYRGHILWGPPPPSSGGLCLVLALHILEPYELRQFDRHSAEVLHRTAEAMRRAYWQRALWLGDPQFTPDARHLADRATAQQLAETISLDRATPSDTLAGDLLTPDESESTTHFSVVDADGMVVANTYTLEASFGARIVVRGAGFLLNNEMGDFNWYPGQTTPSGRIGTPPNWIAPRKRMLSSQTPVIVTRDGKPVVATGSPGGRTIINTVLTVLLNRLEFAMSPAECIQQKRLHHQWFPDVLTLEAGYPIEPATLERLRELGHVVEFRRGAQGAAHSLFFDETTGRWVGVADYRRGGAVAVVE